MQIPMKEGLRGGNKPKDRVKTLCDFKWVEMWKNEKKNLN
jgi:hypothetical protein